MKYAFTTLGLGLLSSFTAWAAPNDLYLQANSFTQTDTALSIGIDAVNDTSVHDKFHRTLILSGFCFLKIAKISLNSSFFPKPIKC